MTATRIAAIRGAAMTGNQDATRQQHVGAAFVHVQVGAGRIENLMVRQGEFHDALEAAITSR